MISLNKVNASNVWKLLELQVLPEQEDFVATNTESIVEAYTTLAAGGTALPFGVYADGQPVGFVMFGYGPIPGDEDEPPVAAGNYCLWRFMIDRNFQGRGYGKAALEAALRYLAGLPCGPAEYIWLSYEPENQRARAMYRSMGFVENGQSVKKGDKLLEIDIDYLTANAPSLCSPILCTELEDNQKVRLLAEGEVKAGDPLFAVDVYEE